MAASQARLLSITARLTNNENSGQSISYSKQRLADQTQQITNEYNEALEATKLTVLTGFNGAEASYTDISYNLMTGLQMADSTKQYIVTDTKGKILVTNDIAKAYEKSNGNYNQFLANLTGTTTAKNGKAYSQADITVNKANEKWVKLFDVCLHPSSQERMQTVDEILTLLPDVMDIYEPITDANPDYQKTVINGILLRVMQGEEYGKIYRLNELINGARRILTLGREDTSIFNVIAVKEATSTYISRRHCTLELDDENGIWYVRDGQWDKDAKNRWIRSLNGTFLNSKEIDDEGDKITPGDIISIGDVKLRVEGY